MVAVTFCETKLDFHEDKRLFVKTFTGQINTNIFHFGHKINTVIII